MLWQGRLCSYVSLFILPMDWLQDLLKRPQYSYFPSSPQKSSVFPSNFKTNLEYSNISNAGEKRSDKRCVNKPLYWRRKKVQNICVFAIHIKVGSGYEQDTYMLLHVLAEWRLEIWESINKTIIVYLVRYIFPPYRTLGQF